MITLQLWVSEDKVYGEEQWYALYVHGEKVASGLWKNKAVEMKVMDFRKLKTVEKTVSGVNVEIVDAEAAPPAPVKKKKKKWR